MFFSQSRILILAGAALLAFVALAGYLYTELAQRSTDLAETTATLADTRVVLQETDQSLVAQVAQNADLQQANKGLQDAIGEWQVALADKESELTTANTELAQTESELTTANTELTQTESELADSRRSLDELDSQHRTLQGQYETLKDTEAAIRRDYNELEQLYGDMEWFQSRVEELREEIAELEEIRRPLILRSDRGGFVCTGSMEPKITCLDEVTWLENPKPKDIVVGSVISFYPDCSTDDVVEDAAGTAHRVMDVKVENGVYHYWPKGDNNREADGCWVPFENVQGYVIEIHKDVQPENATLRSFVNAADAKEGEAWTKLEAATEVLDEIEAEYLALIERYCGAGVKPGDCTLPSPEYEITERVYRRYDAAYDDYEAAFKKWENASEYAQCWHDAALNALYYNDGTPPLFSPFCISPPPPVPPPPTIVPLL